MASQRPPDAFLSYTRFDDRRRVISAFREHLEDAVREVTGQLFEIFQDVDGIGIGEHWPNKLDQMLDQARFFIPIVTPSYITSEPCREELEKFFRAEAERGRNDLVLPIYYIHCNALEDDVLRAADPLVNTLHERQYHDWRELRYKRFDAKEVRRALERLAREIDQARHREVRGSTVPERRQPQVKEQLVFEELHAQAKQTGAAIRPGPTIGSPRIERRTETQRLLKVGHSFRDIPGAWYPEMLVIPAGEFRMGSTEPERRWAIKQGAERGWLDAERPQHRVMIPEPFAVGKYAVTRGQFAAFIDATDHDMSGECAVYDGNKWVRNSSDWCSPGFEQTDEHPVVCVSWDDADAYAAWLSKETGQSYRLLSEAEWEYACRAGSATWYSWGDDPPTRDRANLGTLLRGTTPGDIYSSNRWGLHDMHGNVMEWVQDCWNVTYEGAPNDSRSWTSGDCSQRVLRGGFWGSGGWNLRCAARYAARFDYRSSMCGFRIARVVEPPPDPIVRIWSQTPEDQLKKILTNTKYRLFFNPTVSGLTKSKIMKFDPNGQILEGQNNNETTWRIRQDLLELLDNKGNVHSRFYYSADDKRFFHTNDPDTGSILKHGIRDQYMIPEE
jgi:formylglycine-generating enzyme required for sulfatase activity